MEQGAPRVADDDAPGGRGAPLLPYESLVCPTVYPSSPLRRPGRYERPRSPPHSARAFPFPSSDLPRLAHPAPTQGEDSHPTPTLRDAPPGRYIATPQPIRGPLAPSSSSLSGDLPLPTGNQPSSLTMRLALVGTQAQACRFCGEAGAEEGRDPNPPGGDAPPVCGKEECQRAEQEACDQRHGCGHWCGGYRQEGPAHLPCLQGPCLAQWPPSTPHRPTQQADDLCPLCGVDPIQAHPAIRLGCGHIVHLHCAQTALRVGRSGARLSFTFMQCPLCKGPLTHPALDDLLEPLLALKQVTLNRGHRVLADEQNMTDQYLLADAHSPYYQAPERLILDKLVFFQCHRCRLPYYGGRQDCARHWEGAQQEQPAEAYVCGDCFGRGGAQATLTLPCQEASHRDFWVYKCRYCCAVATWFCFGTTHFCSECHERADEFEDMPVALLPPCPGPAHCPLRVAHPPHGQEFRLNCQLCLEEHERDPIIWQRVQRARRRQQTLRTLARYGSALLFVLLFLAPVWSLSQDASMRALLGRSVLLVWQLSPLYFGGGCLALVVMGLRHGLWGRSPGAWVWKGSVVVVGVWLCGQAMQSSSVVLDTILLNIKMVWYLLRMAMQLTTIFTFLRDRRSKALQLALLAGAVECAIVQFKFPLNAVLLIAQDAILMLLQVAATILFVAVLTGRVSTLLLALAHRPGLVGRWGGGGGVAWGVGAVPWEVLVHNRAMYVAMGLRLSAVYYYGRFLAGLLLTTPRRTDFRALLLSGGALALTEALCSTMGIAWIDMARCASLFVVHSFRG